MPDFLEYLGDEHGNLTIKHGVIGHQRDLETCKMHTYRWAVDSDKGSTIGLIRLHFYREKVRETYKKGTFRFGYLDNISLVGTVSEESGGYIPDVLDMLEESPFLKLVRNVMNKKKVFFTFLCCYWKSMSLEFSIDHAVGRTFPIERHASCEEQWRSHLMDASRRTKYPNGRVWKVTFKKAKVSLTILWQKLRVALSRQQHLLLYFRNSGFNELQNLKFFPRSMIEREIVFEDRTPAHADHVGFGFDRRTTAAVGKVLLTQFKLSKVSFSSLINCIFRCFKSHTLWWPAHRKQNN